MTPTLGWVEKNAVLTRMQDGTTGAMVRVGEQQAPGGSCGAEDAGGQARRGQGGASADLEAAGANARVRARSDYRTGCPTRPGALDLGCGRWEALLAEEEYFVTDAVNWAVEDLSDR